MKLTSKAIILLSALLAVSCGGNRSNASEEAVDENVKLIALSFDDGPNLSITPQVLDVLEANGAKASFFVIGQNINDESAAMMKRAHDMGCDIENHSFTHSSMVTLSEEQIKEEIAKTSALVEQYVGETPKFFRPPYIHHNELMHDAIELTFISGRGCNDWVPNVTAEQRAADVIEHAEDGQIVLVHDFEGNVNTVEALKTIIPELQAQGFKFVTVPEIFAMKGVEPGVKNGKIYTNVLTD